MATNSSKGVVAQAQEEAALAAYREANKGIIEDDDLRNLSSFKDVMELAAGMGMDSIESMSDDYGIGFDILDNKDRLVGKPFVIIEWRFSMSKQYNSEFVSALVIDADDNKWIVNDGSTGMCQQLREVRDARIKAGKRNPQTMLSVKHGLRKSPYETVVINPKTREEETIQAVTYYLN